MYNGIKRTVELAQNEMAPLKSSSGEVLSDKNQQIKIWIEHYMQTVQKHNYCHSPRHHELDTEPTAENLALRGSLPAW